MNKVYFDEQSVAEAITKYQQGEKMSNDNPVSYTIQEFCEAYHISRVHYYTLKAEGKTPQELRLGRRVIITRRAAEAWEDKMMNENHNGQFN